MKDKINKEVEKQTLWALTFTKKLVIVIIAIFVLYLVYSAIVMTKFFVFDSLGTYFVEICDLVKTVAFGYLVKSGFENVPKIIIGMKNDQEIPNVVLREEDIKG